MWERSTPNRRQRIRIRSAFEPQTTQTSRSYWLFGRFSEHCWHTAFLIEMRLNGHDLPKSPRFWQVGLSALFGSASINGSPPMPPIHSQHWRAHAGGADAVHYRHQTNCAARALLNRCLAGSAYGTDAHEGTNRPPTIRHQRSRAVAHTRRGRNAAEQHAFTRPPMG